MHGYPGKRLIDIVGSLGLLLATFPFLLLALVLNLIDGHRNPFFLQKRIGLNRKEFTIYKFRTMKSSHVMDAPTEVKRNAPELTKIGRFLRNTSLDELPQLLNVLKGDMSIIGPRPHAPIFAENYAKYEPEYYKRYCVRPGLVCLVQVTLLRYLNETPEYIRSRVKTDFEYIENMSFKQDVQIFYRAVCYILKLGNSKSVSIKKPKKASSKFIVYGPQDTRNVKQRHAHADYIGNGVDVSSVNGSQVIVE